MKNKKKDETISSVYKIITHHTWWKSFWRNRTNWLNIVDSEHHNWIGNWKEICVVQGLSPPSSLLCYFVHIICKSHNTHARKSHLHAIDELESIAQIAGCKRPVTSLLCILLLWSEPSSRAVWTSNERHLSLTHIDTGTMYHASVDGRSHLCLFCRLMRV